MDAALSSSAPADTESVPVPDRSRGPETDVSGPVPSPDADTPTAEPPFVALDAPAQIAEQPSTTVSPPTPPPDVPPPAQDPSAADGQPPPPAAVPLPPSPGPEVRDIRPGRKAQQDADVGSAAKDISGCPCKGGGRNLVVCIDGTSNQFSKKNTNVVELYSRLVKENDKQLTFYNSGIGTYARPSWRSFSYYKQVIANKLDLAFALRFDKIIIGSYEWLADNYVEGDRIFLFGFSRGAYQVRALSAMIDRMGLIHKGNADQIPFAYELYSHDDDEDDSLSHGVFAVLWQIIRWALYDLTFPQHLWVAWNSAGSSTALKRFTIWMVLALILLQWIWTVGRNDTPETISRIPTADHDDPRPRAPEKNNDPDSISQILTANHDDPRPRAPEKNDDRNSVSDGSSVSGGPDGAQERLNAVRERQERFKKAFARDVRVHFVGAWDTVSSVGLVRDKTLPGTTDGMRHVCYFRHALALHERRVKFLPEFVHGGLGPLKAPGYYDSLEDVRDTILRAIHELALGGNDPRRLDSLFAIATALSAIASSVLEKLFPDPITPAERPFVQSQDPPHTKEVWFHGSHSDIGGGSSPNERLKRFGPALRWMSFEARLAGLRISKEPRRWDTQLSRTSSLSPFWRLIELMPVKRLTYYGASGTTYRPHLSSKRRIQPGQLVYGGLSQTVKARLCAAGLKIEHDPYLGAEDLLKQLEQHVSGKKLLREQDLVKIETLSSSVLGQQQLRDMKEDISTPLTKLLELYKGHHGNELLVIHRLLYALEYSFDAMVNSRPLYEILGASSADGAWAFPRPVTLHATSIVSLLYMSGDEERVISCDWAGSKKTWDMSTGQPTDASDRVEDVWAISPDGTYTVSSYHGNTLAVLDFGSGDLYARLADPPDASYGTIISPDSCLVACGTDKGIRLWDIRGRLVRNTTSITTSTTLSSSRLVIALAFSSKGEYLAAGGVDAAIHIWDMNHRDISVGDLVGHTHWVRSVMFSPDDERLVSASYDGTVRIWHKITRDTLRVFDTLHVLSGHLSGVRTAAFSPNGKYVASGSLDLSVRIWDTTTGQLVGVPLNGHTSPIGCVIFSGDGTRVISGAKDGTIRIWDRMPAVPFVGHDIPLPFPVPVLMPAVEPTSDAPLDAVGAAEAGDAGPVANSELKTESDGADPPGAAIGSQVPSGPGVEGSDGEADAQAPRTDGTSQAATPTEDDDLAGTGSRTPADIAEVGPEAAVPADASTASTAQGLGDSVPDTHSSEDHESPEECGARAATVEVASTRTAMVGVPEDATDASPTLPAPGLEELATGARETTPNLDPHAAGDPHDSTAPVVEVGTDAHPTTCDSSAGETVGDARGSDAPSSEPRGTRGAGESSGPESLVGGDDQGDDVAPDSHVAEPGDFALEPVVCTTETSGDA